MSLKNLLRSTGVGLLFTIIAFILTGNPTLSWLFGLLIFYLEVNKET